jgi:hypothetical protein
MSSRSRDSDRRGLLRKVQGLWVLAALVLFIVAEKVTFPDFPWRGNGRPATVTAESFHTSASRLLIGVFCLFAAVALFVLPYRLHWRVASRQSLLIGAAAAGVFSVLLGKLLAH